VAGVGAAERAGVGAGAAGLAAVATGVAAGAAGVATGAAVDTVAFAAGAELGRLVGSTEPTASAADWCVITDTRIASRVKDTALPSTRA
jgi:hypothetical protein